MASLRRRYYTWLIKAYFKKMSKTIISSLILGILIFFAIIGLLNYYFRPLLFKTNENIGYTGTYTVQTIPKEILSEVSIGLTRVDEFGQVHPAAAQSWSIKDEKIYTIKIKPGQYFHNGKELTSANINYNFENVTAKAIDKYTIQYILQNPYSPFLATISRPIFGKNLEGVGRYKVEDIDVNGGFVRSITLSDSKSKDKKKKIFFYPTQRALKIAFMLGEVSRVYGLTSTKVDDIDLAKWKKVKVDNHTDYTALITIFYNNNDSILNNENKKVRQALNYSLPEKIGLGERAYGPIPKKSMYYNQPETFEVYNLELAKTLLESVEGAVTAPLEISVTEEYQRDALEVQKAWKQIGIESKIKIVQDIPTDFQVFIYRMKLPADPDQYVLWHSDQRNNITHYKNLRIDKLLEDGRSISDIEKRKKIYADFQKYITDDVPASFFYFPIEYSLSKT